MSNHRNSRNFALIGAVCSAMFGHAQLNSIASAADNAEAAATGLREAVTFYASFDHGVDADAGGGERRLHHAPTLAERKQGRPGLPKSGVVSIASGKGRCGDALRFDRAAPDVVFFQVENNLQYVATAWGGAVSFWLKLDPERDLPPGYCDPMFITPRAFNDGAVWTDFSDGPQRSFRHGAFPDRQVWDPQMRDFGQIPVAELPLTTVADPPFSRDAWTHVVVTFDHFNTGLPDGTSAMYLNGQLAGEVGPREQTFTWDPKEATIVLGINYVGLFDELALFSRPLTANEVRALFESPDMLHTP